MEASVWIAPPIVAPDGEVIVRSSAETIPVVSVSDRPNGLPIARTPSPTARSPESPSVSGCSFAAPIPVTRTTAMSVAVSEPSTRPVALVPSANVTSIVVAPSTTCALVMTSPFRSITNPLPSAADAPEPTTRSTTPGDELL
jgi:hypothetical protein